MHTTARRHLPSQLFEYKPPTQGGETLGARAVRLARTAAALHMAEVARVRLDPGATPAWRPHPSRGLCSPLAEGAD